MLQQHWLQLLLLSAAATIFCFHGVSAQKTIAICNYTLEYGLSSLIGNANCSQNNNQSNKAMQEALMTAWKFSRNCAFSDEELITTCQINLVRNQKLDCVSGKLITFTNVSAFFANRIYLSKINQNHHGCFSLNMFPANERLIFNIHVISKARSINITSSSASAVEGSHFELTCSASGANPKPKIHWQPDPAITEWMQLLNNSNFKQWTPFQQINQSLQLNVTRDLHGKSVSCSANNSLGVSHSAIYQLNVLYKAESESTKAINATLGDTVSIQCKAQGRPQPLIQIISPTDTIVYRGQSSEITYRLSVKSKSDQGKYKCIATNSIGSSTSITSLTVHYSPNVTVNASQIRAKEHSRITVACSADAVPAAQNNFWLHTVTGKTRVGWLLQLDLSREYAGIWLCNATNQMHPTQGRSPVIGSGSAAVNISVLYPPDQPIITNFNNSLIIGSDIRAKCLLNPFAPGNPKAKLNWFQMRNGEFYLIETGPDLYLQNITHLEAGKYECRAANQFGTSLTTAALTVLQPPQLLLQSLPKQPITRRSGEVGFSLRCEFFAVPLASIYWFKDSQPIHRIHSLLYSIVHENITDSNGRMIQRSLLKFIGKDRKILQPHDNAMFVCLANNSIGSQSFQFHLKVQYAAEMKLLDSYGHNMDSKNITQKVALENNGNALVTCSAIGEPKPTLKIISPQGKLQNLESEITDDDNNHVTGKITVNEIGSFTCLASNELGNATHIVAVVHQSPPDPPTQLRVADKDWDFVTLTWIPGFHGGRRVQYHAFAITDQQTIHQQCSSDRVHNFTQLLPNINYSFIIMASNALGSTNSTQLLKVKTHELKLPKPRLVLITDNNQLKVIALRDFCLRIEASEDAGKTWALQSQSTCSFNKGHRNQSEYRLAIVNPLLLYRVSLCLLQRNEVCGEAVMTTSSASVSSLPEISSSTIGIVGGTCCLLIIILTVILLYFCCKRPKQYKGIEANSVNFESKHMVQGSKRKYERSDNKPYALVQPHPSLSADNVAASAAAYNATRKQQFSDDEISRQNGVFATLRSGANPIDLHASNPTILQFDDGFNNEPPELSLTSQRKVLYEVVV